MNKFVKNVWHLAAQKNIYGCYENWLVTKTDKTKK